MSRSLEPSSANVTLADVDETMLERLLELALSDAAPDDVTPPHGSGTIWNTERVDWFRGYHRAAAAGLDGPAQEKSWAVLCAGSPAGCIRLKRTGDGSAETGIWLGRGYRGRGVGGAALDLVLAQARLAGLGQVIAHTTAANIGAQRLLVSAGAVLARGDDGSVSAVVVLFPGRSRLRGRRPADGNA